MNVLLSRRHGPIVIDWNNAHIGNPLEDVTVGFTAYYNLIDDLVVFDSLEVGPVRIEPRRVTATYTVTRNAERDSNWSPLRVKA